MISLSRRRLVAGLGLAGLGAALAACGQQTPPTPVPPPPAKPAAPEPTKPAIAAPEPTKPAAAPPPTAPPTTVSAAASTPAQAAAPSPQAGAQAPAAPAKPAAGGPVKTLTYFAGPEDLASINRRMKWFEDQGFYQEHPNIKVDWVNVPGVAEFWQKLLTSIAAGTPPDFAKAKEAFIFELAARKGLAPLDPYVKSSGLNPDAFAPAGWQNYQYKGGQYGLPLEPLIMALFMNDDLYQKAGLAGADGRAKAPVDWKEWREQNKALQKAVPQGGWAFQYYEYTTREWNLMFFNQFLVAAGGRLWADDERTKLDINSEQGLKALQFLLDMIYEDKTSQPPTNEAGSDPRWRPVYAGQIANWIQGIWIRPSYQSNAPNMKYSLGLIPKDGRYAHPAQGDGNAIPKAGKNIDEAWETVRWFAQPKQDVSYRQVMPSLPVLKESLNADAFAKDPYLAFFGQIWTRPDNVTRPLVEGWDEMAVAVSTELQAAFFKQKGAKESLNAAKEVGERAVAKAKASL